METKRNKTMDYPLWRRALRDVRPIDIFMILFLIFVVLFFLYINFVNASVAESVQNSEALK